MFQKHHSLFIYKKKGYSNTVTHYHTKLTSIVFQFLFFEIK